MRRVLVGTAGWVSGGRLERSRVRWEPLDEALDEGLDLVGLLGESWGDCWGESIVKMGFRVKLRL